MKLEITLLAQSILSCIRNEAYLQLSHISNEEVEA